MFDDLAGDSGFSIDSVEKSSQQNQAPQQQAQSSGYQQQRQEQGGYNGGSYGNNASSNGGGGYQQNQGGGGFQRKEDVVSPPYLPVAFFVEKETPPEIKQKFYHLASKLIGKGYTIRLNPDDPDFVRQVQALSTKNVELYLPWRNFNQLESKHTFNTLTSKDVAQRHFPAWEKIPDAVKAMLANQVRMIFGDRNNSIALMLITFSPDGASRIAEITKDTGRVSFIIKMACSYGFSVVNMGKQSSESLLEKYFDLQ
jgi:hypothetical protein